MKICYKSMKLKMHRQMQRNKNNQIKKEKVKQINKKATRKLSKLRKSLPHVTSREKKSPDVNLKIRNKAIVKIKNANKLKLKERQKKLLQNQEKRRNKKLFLVMLIMIQQITIKANEYNQLP